ncbi:MAG: hypothetical protein IT532_15780 [Burkholderiales bacterium]|nr:hypothetical protein [Burkholderiales bacterium]
MEDREVFIVRVYRRSGIEIAGIVERVAGGERRPFQGCGGMCSTLADFLSLDEGVDQHQPNRENEA